MDRTSRNPIAPHIPGFCRLLLATAAATFIGCRSAVERTEILGSWECARGPRVSCFDIYDDGTYRQLITVHGTTELSSTSTWVWESLAGEGMGISFRRFYSISHDGSAISTRPGWWAVVPQRSLFSSTPTLIVFDDEGIAFTKRSTPCPAGDKD